MLTDLEEFQLEKTYADYRLRTLFSMIPHKGMSVLDIGSGSGIICRFLRGRFAKIYLSDISEALVEHLRRVYRYDEHVRSLKLDAQEFTLADKVDLITACDVIEHLPKDQAALDTFYNNLRVGGILFLTVPAFPSLYGARDRKYGHWRRYTKYEIIANVKRAGFRRIRAKYWNATGIVPYLISEKLFKKELVGPARTGSLGLAGKVTDRVLSALLGIEARVSWLPFGLTLIVFAEK